ncbi:drug resistance transporter, EmrB/QacA subfamily [Amycolatopsis xylanica]|uniref:Drug resistance transporter, EmrB/QacA subfamily n=1 Tax=Amycolatopsis xylanica TaxID=589385 RepID=A0A1H3DSS6_9PSEU|nr:MFS transporter [Amycolatopsis xylanica]SDX69158.1 drug resistance transporter, EmrB/QacA subfamily [Amycolatopsis xylanica]
MTSPPAPTRQWLALVLLAMTQFVLVVDTAIVIIAAPSMEKVGFSQESLPWVTNAYALAFGGLLLLGGRASDILGRRRIFIAGLALFAVGSLAGALSTAPLWLIIARVVQGIGAALVSPAALALVMTLFTGEKERNKALGVWGSVAAAGAATGYVFGGLLTEWFGWQSVFWVNLPIVAVVVLLAPRLLPEAKDPSHTSFDLAGAVTVTGGVSLTVYALFNAGTSGWGSAQTLGLFAGAVVLLAAFVVIESRSSNPLISLGIFRIASLRNGNGLTLLTQGAVMPMFFLLTLYVQHVLGFTPLQAGLAQMPAALCFTLLGTHVGNLVSKIGFRIPATVGSIIAAAGLYWLAQAEVGGNYFADVFGPLTVTAIGAVLSVVALMIAATAEAPASSAGLASGLVNVTQQLGGAIGLAVLSSIAAMSTARSAERGNDALTSLTDGMDTALTIGAGIAVVTGLLAAVLFRKKSRPAEAADSGSAVAENEGAVA